MGARPGTRRARLPPRARRVRKRRRPGSGTASFLDPRDGRSQPGRLPNLPNSCCCLKPPARAKPLIPTTYKKAHHPGLGGDVHPTFHTIEQANGAPRAASQFRIGTQYQFYAIRHQFVFTVGGTAEDRRHRSRDVGAPSFSLFTPTVFIGKGLGDLQDRWRGCDRSMSRQRRRHGADQKHPVYGGRCPPADRAHRTNQPSPPNILMWSFG